MLKMQRKKILLIIMCVWIAVNSIGCSSNSKEWRKQLVTEFGDTLSFDIRLWEHWDRDKYINYTVSSDMTASWSVAIFRPIAILMPKSMPYF